MKNNSSATAMLGLEGMAVLPVSKRDDELEYAVETTQPPAGARCAGRRHGCMTGAARGRAICRPVTLVWVKRV